METSMTKSYCHYTTISSEMMDIIEDHLSDNFDNNMVGSRLSGDTVNTQMRDSRNAWVPTTYWLGGLIWHYFKKANDEFFQYNLTSIDGESMQYTQYAVNEKYHWHQDDGITGYYKPQAAGQRNSQAGVTDWINQNAIHYRKLSAILQLVDGDDYEGGSTQIRDVDNSLYTMPRERGTLVFFDSRLYHRAKPVTKGFRKSLVVWAVGPIWK